jgi:hypothetical protein
MTGIWSLIFIRCQNYTLDRTDLYKISNVVLGVETIVADLYSSLEG